MATTSEGVFNNFSSKPYPNPTAVSVAHSADFINVGQTVGENGLGHFQQIQVLAMDKAINFTKTK